MKLVPMLSGPDLFFNPLTLEIIPLLSSVAVVRFSVCNKYTY